MEASDSDSNDAIRSFFDRSDELQFALSECFADGSIPVHEDEPDVDLCVSSCFLSIEHARVLRGAFASMAPNTGSAVLRLQYEALLRGAWVLFAATPGQVSKLAQQLSAESEQAARRLPGPTEMLAAVKEHAPPPVARNLAEFDLHHRHALNSFVHGGIHPLSRTKEGFPAVVALQLVAVSNGLMINAFQVLAALSDSVERADQVRSLHGAFQDCLPALRESSVEA